VQRLATAGDFLALGITYRVLDNWTRQGYLRATNAECGHGYRRKWNREELAVAKIMRDLVSVGLTPNAAERAARNAGELGDGVVITWPG
jgi:MerR HTH family regulatory protein